MFWAVRIPLLFNTYFRELIIYIYIFQQYMECKHTTIVYVILYTMKIMWCAVAYYILYSDERTEQTIYIYFADFFASSYFI